MNVMNNFNAFLLGKLALMLTMLLTANAVAEEPKSSVKGVLAKAKPVQMAAAENTSSVVKLTQIKGRVIVNTGNSIQAAKSNALVPAGTKIITGNDGFVTLIYKDGCVKELKANSMLTVGDATDCIAGAPKERVYQAEAVGATNSPKIPPSTSIPEVGGEYILGALGLAGGLVYLATRDNGNRNISSE